MVDDHHHHHDDAKNAIMPPLLYYEKSTANNMGTRHINDDASAVPLQLSQLRGPGSHMAIGLPSGKERGGDASASSAGRGREEGGADAEGGRGQSSTSDPLRDLMNQDVALVSSPGKAPFDHLIRKRLQMQFFHLMMLNITVSSLLFFHSKGADPSLVEDPALHNGPGAFPTAFEEVRSRALRAYIPLYIISLTIALLGSISALHQIPLGLKFYSLAAFLNLLYGACFVPYLIYFSRYIIDGVMIFVADKLYRKTMPSWLVVSSSGRRFP